jgi:hypothetical protein
VIQIGAVPYAPFNDVYAPQLKAKHDSNVPGNGDGARVGHGPSAQLLFPATCENKIGSVMRKYLIPLAASAALLGASHAFAAQTSANFQARVNIVTSCIVSASNRDFGSVGVIVGG